MKLMNEGLLLAKLKSSLLKFYGHHHDLVNNNGMSVSEDNIVFRLSYAQFSLFLVHNLS
jgi:hypothetical protein